jgi:hypothetical protein
MNNHRPSRIRADAATRGTGAGAGTPGQALGDAAVRRLREALKRELAAATAAGDQAARRRILASLESAITT